MGSLSQRPRSLVTLQDPNVSCNVTHTNYKNLTTSMEKPTLEFIDVEAGEGTEGLSLHPNVHIDPSVSGTRIKGQEKHSLLHSMGKSITNAKHPIAAFFHLFFKGFALCIFLFGSLVFDSFVFICVLCILLLAFDFWTVKNVTGRLLVGLRWWNRINEDGSNEWIFESYSDQQEITMDPLDARVFWVGLYTCPIIWSFLFLLAILKLHFQWAMIIIIALVLNGANIIGYTKCKKDAKEKMQSIMSQGVLNAFSTSTGTSLLSAIGGFAMKNSNPTPNTTTSHTITV